MPGDGHLVRDGEVVQPRHQPGRLALEAGRGVGQALGEGVGGVGAAAVGRQVPGEAHIRQGPQAIGQPLQSVGDLELT